jgi:antitoxin (DNA-binding transcriptional repressor) of toxin-antitoxin stability system
MLPNPDKACCRLPVPDCSYGSYITVMRAVGVREVKNKLSEYLRIVAGGETVLVTDHGRVIAQLAPPPAHTPPALSEDEALERLAAAGRVRLPRRKVPSPESGPVGGVPAGIDLARILDDVRARGHDG